MATMTRREKSLSVLKKLGFKVAPSLTPEERKIHAMPRAKARAIHQGTIGWRLENMWPLAWILGFDLAPPASGAQLGGKTVPKGFHPIAGTGVIHERRHALTWATSPRVKWDDTDLST